MKIPVTANVMNTLSDGDKRFIEIFRRLKNQGHLARVMLPREGYNICKNENLDVPHQILPTCVFSRLDPVLSIFFKVNA